MITKFEKKDTGLYYEGRFISSFIPVLQAIDEKKDVITGNISKIYYIYILNEGKRLPEHKFNRIENISYFQIWPECCDAVLTQRQKRLLNFYIQMQAGQCIINHINYYSRLGYFPTAYIFSQNMIIDLEANEGSCNEANVNLPMFKTNMLVWSFEKKILENIFKIKKGFSEILFLYDVLAITKSLFCKAGYNPNFFLAIFGKSGMGKTLLSRALFVQHESQNLNFKMGNKITVEKTMELFTGHTVLIDDYHPEALRYDKERQEGILDLIARKSDMKDSGMAVITAEFRGGCFSIQDRMFQMEVNQGMDNYEAIQYINTHNSDYNMLLFHIAEKTYTSIDETIKLIRRQFGIYSFDEPKENFRVIYASKIFKICIDLIKEIVFSKDEWDEIKKILNEEVPEKYLRNLVDQYRDKQRSYMNRLLKYQGGIDWINLLYDLIYVDEIFVQCPREEDVDKSCYEGMAIWSREGRIYIKSATLNRGLTKYFGRKVSSKELIKELLEEHILCTDKSPSLMKKVNKRYYYVINESMLKDVCDLWRREKG